MPCEIQTALRHAELAGLKVDVVGNRVRWHCFTCAGGAEILSVLGLSMVDILGEK